MVVPKYHLVWQVCFLDKKLLISEVINIASIEYFMAAIYVQPKEKVIKEKEKHATCLPSIYVDGMMFVIVWLLAQHGGFVTPTP